MPRSSSIHSEPPLPSSHSIDLGIYATPFNSYKSIPSQESPQTRTWLGKRKPSTNEPITVTTPSPKRKKTSLDSRDFQRTVVPELNDLQREYQSIIQKRTLPTTRLVEDFFHYTYLRKNPLLEWESSDFSHTFHYLTSFLTTDQALKLSGYMIGREVGAVRAKMHLSIKKEELPVRSNSPVIIDIRSPVKRKAPIFEWKQKKERTEPLQLLSPPKKRSAVSMVRTGEDTFVEEAVLWSNTWLALIEQVHGDAIKRELNAIFYDPRRIRERFSAIKDKAIRFEDENSAKLFTSIERVLPIKQQDLVPYFVAAITDKPLNSIRNFIIDRQMKKINQESTDEKSTARIVKEMEKQMLPLLLSHNEPPPTTMNEVEILIYKFKIKQTSNDALLLFDLVGQAQRIHSKITELSGGYLVINSIDNSKIPKFSWIDQNIMKQGVEEEDHYEDFLTGCDCEGDSCATSDCGCVQEIKNQNDADTEEWEPHYTNGLLRPNFSTGTAIYECNSKCDCSSSCSNRVTQNGPELNMIIFKDRRKGWAVRSVDLIVKGSYVCEYLGEVIPSEVAEIRGKEYDKKGLSFLLDLDLDGRDCRYTIDATRFGNVSRFFNHSCEPNTQIVNVFVDILDPERPRICFFAKRDIKPGEEITFDYKYEPTANPQLRCSCGMKSCRKWLV